MRYFVIIIVNLLLMSNILSGKTTLNGSCAASIDFKRESSYNYKWGMEYPWYSMELRFLTNPIENIEFFVKTITSFNLREKKYNRWYIGYPIFNLAEAHTHYQYGKKDKFNTYLFINQLRFSLNDPLFFLVNTDKNKWDEDSSIGTSRVAGFTMEIDGFLSGFYSKFFSIKMYNQNVDAMGIRIYEEIIKEKLRIGTTTTYKRWQGDPKNYNLVTAGDIWFSIYKTSITFEAAKSSTPSDYSLQDDVDAYKVEIRRDIESYLGDLGIIASLRDIGGDFRAYCSKVYDDDKKYDQKGYYIETKYRVPQKAITFTYHRDYYKKHTLNYSETEDYFEAYVEFIKDINLKLWYKTTHQFNGDKIEITKLDGTKEWVYLQDDRWSHFFSQLEMQNKISHIKLQFKIKNIQTVYLKYIYGVEISENITSRLKTLNRFLVVDEIYRVRHTFWSQIQYNFGNNTDFYLEYGNDSYVNDDLVNDKDFVESSNTMLHKIHLYIKVSF